MRTDAERCGLLLCKRSAVELFRSEAAQPPALGMASLQESVKHGQDFT